MRETGVLCARCVRLTTTTFAVIAPNSGLVSVCRVCYLLERIQHTWQHRAVDVPSAQLITLSLEEVATFLEHEPERAAVQSLDAA